MVHALSEIWRVLVPDGSLLDLRPLATNPPLEIVADGQVLLAGQVDDSLDITNVTAANESLARVVLAGWFIREHEGSFDFAIYWDTPDEMKNHFEENWIKALLPEAAWAKARWLMASSGEGARVRVRRNMVIARYRKNPTHKPNPGRLE